MDLLSTGQNLLDQLRACLGMVLTVTTAMLPVSSSPPFSQPTLLLRNPNLDFASLLTSQVHPQFHTQLRSCKTLTWIWKSLLTWCHAHKFMSSPISTQHCSWGTLTWNQASPLTWRPCAACICPRLKTTYMVCWGSHTTLM